MTDTTRRYRATRHGWNQLFLDYAVRVNERYGDLTPTICGPPFAYSFPYTYRWPRLIRGFSRYSQLIAATAVAMAMPVNDTGSVTHPD
jgi:hypothetical protein